MVKPSTAESTEIADERSARAMEPAAELDSEIVVTSASPAVNAVSKVSESEVSLALETGA